MDTFERNATRALAIAYHAYMEAGADNWQPWAKLLIQAQRDTGVELLPVSTLLYGPAPESVPIGEMERRSELVEGAKKLIEGDDEGDGGALVPAPKPTPRKPSPGASVAAAAAQFYARSR